jgi:RimJ/RimL family protein N-acetyltransferase
MIPPAPVLSTQRLILKPLDLEDASAIQEAFPRWEIVRYLNSQVAWPYPPDGAERYLTDCVLPAMAAGIEWHWSLRLHSAPARLIGVVSLMDTPDNNRGLWLIPEWQHRGLMTEACRCVNRFWFEVLRRETLRVPKAIGNRGSCRLSEREGMHIIETKMAEYVSGRMETQVWELTRNQWLNVDGDGQRALY